MTHLRELGFDDAETSRDMKTQAFIDQARTQLEKSPELRSKDP